MAAEGKPPIDDGVDDLAARSRHLIEDARRLCEASARHLERSARHLEKVAVVIRARNKRASEDVDK